MKRNRITENRKMWLWLLATAIIVLQVEAQINNSLRCPLTFKFRPGDGSKVSLDRLGGQVQFLCTAEDFYSNWEKNGLLCGNKPLDILKAEDAAKADSCQIYNGGFRNTEGSELDGLACMGICRIPACENNAWNYNADNGLSSAVYQNLDMKKFLPFGVPQLIQAKPESSLNDLLGFNKFSFQPSLTCAYKSPDSYVSCKCFGGDDGLKAPSTATETVDREKKTSEQVRRTIGRNSNQTSALTPTSLQLDVSVDKSTIDLVRWLGIICAIISGLILLVGISVRVISNSAQSVWHNALATGTTFASMTAFEMCLFILMISQLRLEYASILHSFGFCFAIFMGNFAFLSSGLGVASPETIGSNVDEKLLGLVNYADFLRIPAENLVLYTFGTLAVVVVIVGFVFGLVGMAGDAERKGKITNSLIATLAIVLIMSQYAIGCSSIFSVSYSVSERKIGVAFGVGLVLFLSLGVGAILMFKHIIQKQIIDRKSIGSITRLEEPMHERYGVLYDEYTYHGRYVLLFRLILALTVGATVGIQGVNGIAQLIIIGILHGLYLAVILIMQPYDMPLIRNVTIGIIIVKLLVIVLSLFLVEDFLLLFVSKGMKTTLPTTMSWIILVALSSVPISLLVMQLFFQRILGSQPNESDYPEDERSPTDYEQDRQFSRDSADRSSETASEYSKASRYENDSRYHSEASVRPHSRHQDNKSRFSERSSVYTSFEDERGSEKADERDSVSTYQSSDASDDSDSDDSSSDLDSDASLANDGFATVVGYSNVRPPNSSAANNYVTQYDYSDYDGSKYGSVLSIA